MASGDWDKVAGIYSETYRGTSSAGPQASASEEVDRMKAGPTPPFTARSVRLRPLSVRLRDAGEGCVLVESEERLLWPDGCSRVAAGRLEQRWSRNAGRWALVGSRQLDGSDQHYVEAALMPGLYDAATAMDRLRGKLDSGLEDAPYARRAAAELERRLLPRSLTAQLALADLEPYVAEALRRACVAAMRAWNCSLEGVVELVPYDHAGRPDVLIRGRRHLLPGGRLGEVRYAGWHRCGPERPALAELLVSTTDRAGPRAMPLSPRELFRLVAHELGHCFWLGECSLRGPVMGPDDWNLWAWSGPFLPQRRAVIHVAACRYSTLAATYDRTSDHSRAQAARDRAAELLAAAGQEPAAPALGWEELVDFGYAPPLVALIWEGTFDVQEGRLPEALRCYGNVLASGMDGPEVRVRTASVRRRMGDIAGCVRDLQCAVLKDPRWVYARDMLAAALQAGGRERDAEEQSAASRRLGCLARAQLEWAAARADRSPRRAASAAAQALAWACRYAISPAPSSPSQPDE